MNHTQKYRFRPNAGMNLTISLLIGTIQYEYSNPTYPHLQGLDLVGVKWLGGHLYQVVSRGQKTIKHIPANRRIDSWLMSRYRDQWRLKEVPMEGAVHRLFVVLPRNLFITNQKNQHKNGNNHHNSKGN
jgi:hypothetical protein